MRAEFLITYLEEHNAWPEGRLAHQRAMLSWQTIILQYELLKQQMKNGSRKAYLSSPQCSPGMS